MANIYYILTTEKEISYYQTKASAVTAYNIELNRCEHLRLERANAQMGTARVIKEHNNIW